MGYGLARFVIRSSWGLFPSRRHRGFYIEYSLHFAVHRGFRGVGHIIFDGLAEKNSRGQLYQSLGPRHRLWFGGSPRHRSFPRRENRSLLVYHLGRSADSALGRNLGSYSLSPPPTPHQRNLGRGDINHRCPLHPSGIQPGALEYLH